MGKPHPLFETFIKLREAYLNLGFEETLNPLFIEETDIYKQWGDEAPAILDRIYYLSGLSRPDVGLSQEKISEMETFGVKLTEQKKTIFQKVLHDYKKGVIASDDLIEEIALALKIDNEIASKILALFPEFKQLTPTPTRLTLRSHQTSGWFLTLSALQYKKSLPIKLFSIDRCFRREQQEDATHLRSHHSASCVVMDKSVTIETGKEVARGLIKQLGFEEIKFQKKKRSANYYQADTETEVFVLSKAHNEWIEVADFGIYSPQALANYGLKYPVLNLGMGTERMAMLFYGFKDIRELVFPQFYAPFELSDRQIVEMIKIESVPTTEVGKQIARAIADVSAENKDAVAPCEFEVWKGNLFNKKVIVKVLEVEAGKKLLGPAGLNQIYVYNGNTIGIPPTGWEEKEEVKLIRERGISTGIRYIDAFANRAATKIEEAVRHGRREITIRVGIVKLPSDINLKINGVALRYITANKKTIDVRGPVFLAAKAEIS